MIIRLLSDLWEVTVSFITKYVWHLCLRPLLRPSDNVVCVPSTMLGDVVPIDACTSSPKELMITDSPLSSTESSTSEEGIPVKVNLNLESAFMNSSLESTTSSEPITKQSLYIQDEVTKVLFITSSQAISSNLTTTAPHSSDTVMKIVETDDLMPVSTTTTSTPPLIPSLRILKGVALESSAKSSPSVYHLHNDNHHSEVPHTSHVTVEPTTMPSPLPPLRSTPPTSPSKYIPIGYTTHVESVWGRMYYCDTTSGETMWTLPGDLPSGDNPPRSISIYYSSQYTLLSLLTHALATF